MTAGRPPQTPVGALLLAAAVVACLAARPAPSTAAVVPGAQVVRAEGRAPVLAGRADRAFQQALEEAFRRGLLECLRALAPERQSPRDLVLWQESVLSRASDFVGAWRILVHEQSDGFVVLEVELEIWREKLARAARASGGVAAAAPPVRLVVLADSFPLPDVGGDEEVEAGRLVASALESELSRRGAVIVSTSELAPWERASGPASEESLVALATAAARTLEADAVLIARLARRLDRVTLSVQLIAVASETTLGAGRSEVVLAGDQPLSEIFSPAARQLAVAVAPRLIGARAHRGYQP